MIRQSVVDAGSFAIVHEIQLYRDTLVLNVDSLDFLVVVGVIWISFQFLFETISLDIHYFAISVGSKLPGSPMNRKRGPIS